MEDKRSLRTLGRRDAIHLLGAGLAASGLVGLYACGKGKEAPAAAPPAAPPPSSPAPAAAPPTAAAPTGPATCESPLDGASTQMRTVMQYKDPSAAPDKVCNSCAQYTAGAYGDCGSCKLFTGPVRPTGGCIAYAPRDPNAPPGAAPAAPKPG